MIARVAPGRAPGPLQAAPSRPRTLPERLTSCRSALASWMASKNVVAEGDSLEARVENDAAGPGPTGGLLPCPTGGRSSTTPTKTSWGTTIATTLPASALGWAGSKSTVSGVPRDAHPGCPGDVSRGVRRIQVEILVSFLPHCAVKWIGGTKFELA